MLEKTIEKLANEFNKIPFNKLTTNKNGYKIQTWLGKEEDDIMICLLKSKYTKEDYHKQDYFFFNYAYKNNYKALSQKYNHIIEIKENECYFSQPECGYAININNMNEESIIIGVLIKKETFFKEYLQIIAKDDALFRFFLIPEKNTFSEEYIKLNFNKENDIRKLLELMMVEYANNDNQEILKSYTLSLLLLIARKYKSKNNKENETLVKQITKYLNTSSTNISLKELSKHFGYHPNYISSLIHKKTGKKFSELLTERKMNNAKVLLENTTLSVEEISSLLGYSDASNFYKTYKKYYGTSPRKKISKS